MLLRAQLRAMNEVELEALSPRARSVYERLAKGTFEFDFDQVAEAMAAEFGDELEPSHGDFAAAGDDGADSAGCAAEPVSKAR